MLSTTWKTLACKAGVDLRNKNSISIICDTYYALFGQLFRVDAKLQVAIWMFYQDTQSPVTRIG